MKMVTLEEAAALLKQHDNYLILMHKSPDGDAVGCAYGLCLALRSIGKKANPLCGDEIPELYNYITDGFEISVLIFSYVIWCNIICHLKRLHILSCKDTIFIPLHIRIQKFNDDTM